MPLSMTYRRVSKPGNFRTEFLTTNSCLSKVWKTTSLRAKMTLKHPAKKNRPPRITIHLGLSQFSRAIFTLNSQLSTLGKKFRNWVPQMAKIICG
jgi:hypothetical protein